MTTTRIDLEKLAKTMKWSWKHADYLILSQDRNTIVVVEETSRAKPDDIEKLENTIEAIRQRQIPQLQGTNPAKIIAVIHAKRQVDTMIHKMLATRSKTGRVYRAANCNEKLKEILREHGIQA